MRQTRCTMTFAASPMPSQRIASGIQASGGIGLMSRNTGLMSASARQLHPISSPSGNARPRGHDKSKDDKPQT